MELTVFIKARIVVILKGKRALVHALNAAVDMIDHGKMFTKPQKESPYPPSNAAVTRIGHGKMCSALQKEIPKPSSNAAVAMTGHGKTCSTS